MELDLIQYRTADIDLPSQRCCLNEGKRGNGIARLLQKQNAVRKREKREKNLL